MHRYVPTHYVGYIIHTGEKGEEVVCKMMSFVIIRPKTITSARLSRATVDQVKLEVVAAKRISLHEFNQTLRHEGACHVRTNCKVVWL